jgi:hypothetical protein
MRIGRAIVIPVILTLGAAGASLAGTATPVAAVHVTDIHVVAQSLSGTVYYHG